MVSIEKILVKVLAVFRVDLKKGSSKNCTTVPKLPKWCVFFSLLRFAVVQLAWNSADPLQNHQSEFHNTAVCR